MPYHYVWNPVSHCPVCCQSQGTCLPWSAPHGSLTAWEHIVHHDDILTWKHFPHYWPFVRGFTGSLVLMNGLMDVCNFTIVDTVKLMTLTVCAQYTNEITYPFTNWNVCVIDIWKWRSSFILHCIMDVITESCCNQSEPMLTHWGRVTHICITYLTIIASDNGLSPGRRQAIIWTNAGILLIGPLGTNFSEILIGIQTF